VIYPNLYHTSRNTNSILVFQIKPLILTLIKREVFEFMRSVDSTRPLTYTISKPIETDICANLSDIISINRYYAWYQRPGNKKVFVTSFINFELSILKNSQTTYFRTFGYNTLSVK
jgi:hypothetical protein